MRKIILVVMVMLLIVCLLTSLRLIKPVQAQQEYIVKPVIFIPADWRTKISQSQLNNEYKPRVARNLEELQSFYANHLGGKTFKFDRNVQVVYSSKIIDPGDSTTSYDYFWKLDGETLIPTQDGVVQVIWVVGSRNLTQTGYGDSGLGRAWLNHEDLLGFNRIGVEAHELGHAFGRSEESRVGKECRSRRSPYHYNKYH